MILACIINEAFFCTFLWHHLFRSSLAQLASFPRFSLFVFLNQILFDLVCIQFVFGFPTDLSEALCCLATLCKRGVLLVTFFVLDWARPLRCRSAGLMLVIGRLDFVFFWRKQHLICTDQNVSATVPLTSVTEPLGNIVTLDKNIFYQCCLLTQRAH